MTAIILCITALVKRARLGRLINPPLFSDTPRLGSIDKLRSQKASPAVGVNAPCPEISKKPLDTTPGAW